MDINGAVDRILEGYEVKTVLKEADYNNNEERAEFFFKSYGFATFEEDLYRNHNLAKRAADEFAAAKQKAGIKVTVSYDEREKRFVVTKDQ